MKKDGIEEPDEILPEYDFSGARPNKYASRYAAGSNVVVANEPAALPLTPAQAEELDRRLAEYQRDRTAGIPWREALDEIENSGD